MAQYISDDDFLELLKKLRKVLAPGGVIFIKENVTETGDTQLVAGDYKGAADLSLTRSMDCFKAIFKNAGYATIVCEKWYANPKCFPILSASLRTDII